MGLSATGAWTEPLPVIIVNVPQELSVPRDQSGRHGTLAEQSIALNDIVHLIQIASEMGFNRRKLEDQRREAAE